MPNAWTILLLSVAVMLAGCATPPVQPAAPLPRALMGSGEAVKAQAAGRWHTTCFNMPFDAGGRPVWGRDLLLADRVAAPLLVAHARDIVLWRFHRRAARDPAGHRFSLLLYTDDASYAAISAAIDADPTVASMLQAGSLSKSSTAAARHSPVRTSPRRVTRNGTRRSSAPGPTSSWA